MHGPTQQRRTTNDRRLWNDPCNVMSEPEPEGDPNMLNAILELTKSDEPVTVIDVYGEPTTGPLHVMIDEPSGHYVFNVLGFGFDADNVEKIDHDARTIRVRS